MKVTSLRRSDWTTQEGESRTAWHVSLDGGPEVPCYDARAAQWQVGQDLPPGWEVRTSQAGKRYLAGPREQRRTSAAAAWRSTSAGFAAEQERMDRRTALMQAVALVAGTGAAIGEALRVAEEMYAWLRETAAQPSDRGGGEGTEVGAAVGGSGGETGGTAPAAAPADRLTHTPDDGHEHDYRPAPREGWLMCSLCGRAKRA